jgi:hypothetical protein
MKKHFILFGILFAILLSNSLTTEAATNTSNYLIPIDCSTCPDYFDDHGLLLWNIRATQGLIRGTVHKTINFLKENGSQTALEFMLNKSESVNLNVEPTSGEWFFAGGLYDSPPSNGILYRTISDASHTLDIASSIPIDSNTAIVESKNPDIVQCTNTKCTALKEGVATVVVSFATTTEQTSLYPMTGIPITGHQRQVQKSEMDIRHHNAQTPHEQPGRTAKGYGKINYREYEIAGGAEDTTSVPAITTVYSFPSITYTITVPHTTNTPQVVSCTGVNPVTATNATVNWSYTDADNDPQSNYQVQVATDSAFSNIVKSVTAGAANPAATRSALTDSLTPNTQYYARVRAYNATNQWSQYSMCAGSFTTTDQSVNGSCGLGVDTCTTGIYSNTPDTDTTTNWRCLGQNGGTDLMCTSPVDDLTCDDDEDCDGGDGFSCSANGPIKVNNPVTYTAKPTSANGYAWYADKSLSHIIGTAYQYKEAFTRTGTYTRWVKITQDGIDHVKSCTARVDCGTKPTGGETACIAGKQKVYMCTSTGWALTELNCGEGAGTGPVVSQFYFSPNIVAIGDSCPLYLEATSASSCTLVKTGLGQNSLTYTAIDGMLKYSGEEKIPVGTYTLSCTGIGLDAETAEFGTKACVSSPDLREE